MGTRIAVMNEGLLQQVGTPQALYDTPDQPVRRRLHRQPVDELRRGHRRRHRATTPGSSGRPTGRSRCRPATASAASPANGRQEARRRASGRSTSTSARPAAAAASFRARADVVEYLGNEELLHVNAADQDIVAIVDSEHRVRPGDIVNLVLPLDKLHLFDARPARPRPIAPATSPRPAA